jgi:hypothetical protein
VSDVVDETLALAERLPAEAVVGVFRRYGRPLAGPDDADGAFRDDDAAPSPRVTLTLADGQVATLRLMSVRMPVDVIANDWFVLHLPDGEPLAMPGPLFAAAAAALARAIRAKQSPT